MGFFEAMHQVLEAGRDDRGNRGDPRLAESGGIDDSAHPEYPHGRVVAADPEEMAAPPASTDYDRNLWRRKLAHVLDHLPASEGQWPDLMTEAGALGLEPAWVERGQREEFGLMIRRAIADRHLTLQEHAKLEKARTLIGLPDPEAEAMLTEIVREAEAFFGGSVEGV